MKTYYPILGLLLFINLISCRQYGCDDSPPSSRVDNQALVQFDTAILGGFRFSDLDTIYIKRYYARKADSVIIDYLPWVQFSRTPWHQIRAVEFDRFFKNDSLATRYEMSIGDLPQKYIFRNFSIHYFPAQGECGGEGSELDSMIVNDSVVKALPYIIKK